MEVWIRNITKDTMVDFDNDHCINLPIEEGKLNNLLGDDEWIIVDSPVGEELTNIKKLNEIIQTYNEVFSDGDEILQMLCKTYLLSEIEDPYDVIIINFDEETETWCCGNGAPYTDEYKGLLLHSLGLIALPFQYTEEMEDWINWEMLWNQAETEGWREVYFKGNHYLVRRD